MYLRPSACAQAVQGMQAHCQLWYNQRESYGCNYLIRGSLYLLLTYCLHGAAGIGLISDVIDFSQADDGAMIAYGLSDQLDDLKVRSPEARLADFVNFWVTCHGLMCGHPWTAMLTIDHRFASLMCRASHSVLCTLG